MESSNKGFKIISLSNSDCKVPLLIPWTITYSSFHNRLLGLLLLAMAAVGASVADSKIISIILLDNVVEEEDGEWICFLGGNSSSGTKKYRGSNSSDGGNTGDGVKIVGGVIGSSDEIEFSEELKDLLPAEAGK
ncbi:hypothetical protein Tco_0610535 [Tanacetum coccineum]